MRRVDPRTRGGYREPEEIEWLHARIIEYTREGMSRSLISEVLNISKRTLDRVRKESGLTRPAGRPFTSEEIEQIEQMLEDGVSMREISRTTGRHQASLMNRYRGRSQWTQSMGGQLRAMDKASRPQLCQAQLDSV